MDEKKTRKGKKGFNIPNIIAYPIIIIISAILMFVFFHYGDNFNPEEDVCEIWEYDCKKCIKHRQKSFCEKCVDDWFYTKKCKEKCLCLEETQKQICDFRLHCGSHKDFEICNDSYFNDSLSSCIDEWGEYDSLEILQPSRIWKECLSAREKTPCEKGEEGWVEEGTEIECLNISQEKCEEWSETKKICRQKTINDYSCEELKKAIILNKKIRYCNDKLIWNEICIWSGWKIFNQEQIYDIAIEKGCEI